MGCTAKMDSTGNSATARMAPRQPSAAAANGKAKPASTPPNGTPACLMENNKLRCCGGARRCKISPPPDTEGP